MNNFKYYANLYDYTLTKDNFNEGEDPSTTQTFECNVRHIKFNTVSELKDEIANRVLYDSAYSRNLYITHLEGNEYDVDWTSKREDDNCPVDEETMEKFRNGEIDLYAGQMMIYIYKVEPLEEPEGLDFD